mgnify:CR=1 FL=1
MLSLYRASRWGLTRRHLSQVPVRDPLGPKKPGKVEEGGWRGDREAVVAAGRAAPPRSPAKRSNGATHGSSAPPAGDNEDDDDDDERKPAGSSSYQELAPLASYQDAEATATANALMESVEWQVQEGKRCRGVS